MQLPKKLVLTLGLSLLVAPVAHAQFVGGAPPAGTPYLMFTVPGVAQAPGQSTIFTCTNPNGVTANIAVQLFDQNGAPQNASPALAVPPGGTVQFATGATAPFSPDQSLSPVSGFTKGAAKIWSDQKKLQCEATRVTNNGSSLSTAALPTNAKGKQKGD
jgi:hypothetical protein